MSASGQAELTQLTNGLRWMVLPLNECPAAPAQGALAIECRSNDEQTLSRVARKSKCAASKHLIA